MEITRPRNYYHRHPTTPTTATSLRINLCDAREGDRVQHCSSDCCEAEEAEEEAE